MNKVRIFNNTTKYKTLSTEFLLEECKHLILPWVHKNIESIDIRNDHIELIGEDCSVVKINTNKNSKVIGKIRWYDKSSGTGYIRLKNGRSAHFYSCNVDGADSLYPEMVTNIDFKEEDEVTCEISADAYMFKSLGFINIKKVG